MIIINNTILLFSLIFTTSLFAHENSQPAENTEKEPASTVMTQQKMVETIKKISSSSSGPNNNLSFKFQGVDMILVSDQSSDRMRLITGVLEANKISNHQMMSMMTSNFHSALDARYAVSNGILFSTYIHPLSPLTEEQLISAVRQVATLASTFGSTYTSGEMTFGAQRQKVNESDEISI